MLKKNPWRFLVACSAGPAAKTLVLLSATVLLGACAALGGSDAPPAKEPAKLEISISADTEVNQNVAGRGSPVLLRVYELKSDIAFQDADYFALQNTDKAVLGADLLAVDQFILRPGETRKITRKSNPETMAIGIFAGYRDLPNSTWRVIHKLQPAADKSWYRVIIPAHKVRLSVELQSQAIQLIDEDAETQPAQYANESLKGLETGADSLKKPVADLVKAPAQVPDMKEPFKAIKLP